MSSTVYTELKEFFLPKYIFIYNRKYAVLFKENYIFCISCDKYAVHYM